MSTKRSIVDLTHDCVETDTKKAKINTGATELDPILIIVNFDGDTYHKYGDHSSLSGITGYQSGNDMAFYTDEMYQGVNGGEAATASDDDKLMALYDICTDDAVAGESYRATVVFTYPM